MNGKRHEGHEREIPHGHIYHAVMPIVFVLMWILDSIIFKISTILNNYVPFIIRLILFILVFGIALIFIELSHRALFKSHKPSDSLITNGILGHVRNPMYSGILLIYVAFILLSISIISIFLFIPVFLVYNWMANFEENILEDMFGDEYIQYKKRVPKWIPNPFKK
ncbi:MAG: methyltransferase family protein [Candidatus Hodarchaeota archaeon]